MKDIAGLYRRATVSTWIDWWLVGTVAVFGCAGVMFRQLTEAAAGRPPSGPASLNPVAIGLLLLLTVATAGLLRWRRRYPVTVLVGGLLAATVVSVTIPPGLFSGQVVAELVLVCFAIGSWGNRPWLAGTVLIGLLVLLTLASRKNSTSIWQALATGLAVIALPTVAGLASRARRHYLEQVEQRLAQAEQDRDEQAHRAVRDERARIARELHDVVAHHVSLIGIQAGAARTALGTAPQQVAQALSAIEATSRDAVTEMHHLLRALRPAHAPTATSAPHATSAGTPPTDPQPGLPDLPDLLRRLRSAGYHLTLRADGLDEPLPPGLSLNAYRVVEEALTNVTRHCAARAATVTVRVTTDSVTVDVEDPGPPVRHTVNAASPGPVAGVGSGRGLLGMAERVDLYGGTLHTGHTPGGGFRVSAMLRRDGGNR